MPHKFDKTLMGTAVVWSAESYCKKRQVGAVISIEGKLLMTGYNGTLSGKPNQCEDSFYQCPNCKHEDVHPSFFSVEHDTHAYTNYRIVCNNCNGVHTPEFKPEDIINLHHHSVATFLIEYAPRVTRTNPFVYHAEENAILSCTELGIPTKGTEMHVTTAPCPRCAKMIARVGIIRLVYKDDYKDSSGIEFLKKAGVTVEKIKG